MSAAPEGMAPEAKARAARKVRTGVVVSDAMNKTVMVRIAQVSRHRAYGKTLRRSSKLSAHDENNEAHVGDFVRIEETRPLSKLKRWKLKDIIRKAALVPEAAVEPAVN